MSRGLGSSIDYDGMVSWVLRGLKEMTDPS
jgi:hypothetical protein